MGLILDDSMQSYTVGSSAPFGANFDPSPNNSGFCTIENTIPGPYGDTKALDIPSNNAIVFPQLPAITLPQAQAGVTYHSLGVPEYTTLSIFAAYYFNTYPVLNGDIISLHSDTNPFSGVSLAAVRILEDGTISITSPSNSAFSPCQAISTYSLYPGKFYFFQLNISFSAVGLYVAVDMTVLVNGVAVVTSAWTTNQLLTNTPVRYINNIWYGSAGNGVKCCRFSIYDTIQASPFYPHAGSPVARVSQGVIEIAKFVSSASPISGSCPLASAPLGIPYSQAIPVAGGSAPLSFARTGGSLPTGLSLNTVTGVISGTPTVVGSYAYQITITDAIARTFVVNCNLLVPPTPSRPAKFCQSQF